MIAPASIVDTLNYTDVMPYGLVHKQLNRDKNTTNNTPRSVHMEALCLPYIENNVDKCSHRPEPAVASS